MIMRKIDNYVKSVIGLLDNQKVVVVFLSVGLIFIIYSLAFFVAGRSVNIPCNDQWNISEIITGKVHYNIWQLFIYQHNEHRIGVGLLIIKFLAVISHWDQILEIKFISFLFVTITIIFLCIKNTLSKKWEILDIFIPFLVLNIFQAENLVWGFQITFILPVLFFALWILSIIKIKSIKRSYLVLTILSFLSSYSSLQGLILPIFTVGFILYDYFNEHRGKLLASVAVVANILVAVSYFIGYHKNFQTGLLNHISIQSIDFFSLSVSNGFFYLSRNAMNHFLCFIVLAALFVAVYKLVRFKTYGNNAIGIALILFGLLFVSLITLGRSSLGLDAAISSRYVSYVIFFPLGLFFIFSGFKRGYILNIVLFIFIICNFFVFSQTPIKWADYVRVKKIMALNCYINKNTSNITVCYKIFPLYPYESFLDERIVDVLKYKGLK